jgi:hypothetical protein
VRTAFAAESSQGDVVGIFIGGVGGRKLLIFKLFLKRPSCDRAGIIAEDVTTITISLRCNSQCCATTGCVYLKLYFAMENCSQSL